MLLRIIAFPLAALLAIVLASCADNNPGGTPTAAAAVTDHDLGQGLIWAGPADAGIDPFVSSTNGCAQAPASVKWGQTRVALTLLGADCEQTDRPPINGSHGRYLTPPSFATGVATAGDVPAGTLVTFQQVYSEYTNDRHDFTDTVGLVTLSDGGDFSVLMLVYTTSKDGGGVEAVTTVACAIRPAGAAAPTNGSCPTE